MESPPRPVKRATLEPQPDVPKGTYVIPDRYSPNPFEETIPILVKDHDGKLLLLSDDHYAMAVASKASGVPFAGKFLMVTEGGTYTLEEYCSKFKGDIKFDRSTVVDVNAELPEEVKGVLTMLEGIITMENAKKSLPKQSYALLKQWSENDDEEEQLSEGQKLMQDGCKQGSLSAVKEALKTVGVNDSLFNKLKVYPLSLAIANGKVNVARFLLEQGASLESVSTTGLYPMHYAFLKMQPECIELLKEKGALLDVKDSVGRTPVQLLCGLVDDIKTPIIPSIVCHRIRDIMSLVPESAEEYSDRVKAILDLPAKMDIENVPAKEELIPDGMCFICFDTPADTMVLPCEHTVVCKSCSEKLKNTNDAKTCVKCRNPITFVLD